MLSGFNAGLNAERYLSVFCLPVSLSNPSGEKSFHKITIKPKQPGLTVRAKSGYYSR